ncbi:MAG: cell division protein FtsQ/DivIB [Gammaproteobacteria bacterium]|nr:cell division protein FtsQ/DivIB [Gammaproteobacteria bacterium]
MLPKLPRLPVRGAGVLLSALAVITFTYYFSAALLDRPISSITIEGPFQRVSALQIEEAIGDEIGAGFFTADLGLIRSRVMALPWIDEASVARRWPGTLAISVTEQVPAATWGERGLLNTRGELFVTDARHIPAELPRLDGPGDQSGKVAGRYLDLREKLIPSGLDLREVMLDARGAWSMQLSNGVEIRLGRRDVEARAQLFIDVVANIVASREAEIEFVDMRYSNGFTIGWKGAARSPAGNKPLSEGGMVAGLAN